ncbi:MAG TPA: acyl-CoA dehydrogenase, partial [Balneolaceae bacterium]|nr:acyl-CoA dehydrogenase [Balneolaceae bacterium]
MEILNESFGFLLQFPLWAVIIGLVLITGLLVFWETPLLIWAIVGTLALWGLSAPAWVFGVFAALIILFGVKPIRRAVLTKPLMKLLDSMNFLPTISET